MATERWVVFTPLSHWVRLSEAAWTQKLLVSHPELGTRPEYERELRLALEHPDFVIEGWGGEILSLRWCQDAPHGAKHLCVVYRPGEPTGFVITAFFISRYDRLLRRPMRWKPRR